MSDSLRCTQPAVGPCVSGRVFLTDANSEEVLVSSLEHKEHCSLPHRNIRRTESVVDEIILALQGVLQHLVALHGSANACRCVSTTALSLYQQSDRVASQSDISVRTVVIVAFV